MAVHCLLVCYGLDQRPVLVGSGEHAGVRVLLRGRLRLRPRDGNHLPDLEGRPGEKSVTESQEASETSCSSLGPFSTEQTPRHFAARLVHPESANQRTKEGRGVFIFRNAIFISY